MFTKFKVDNLGEHADLCAQTYDETLAKYPTYKSKIDQSVRAAFLFFSQMLTPKWSNS